MVGVNAVKDFLELVTELVDPNAELNVHGERVHALVADVLHGRECAATDGSRLGDMVQKTAECRVLVALEVGLDALCNLADRKKVALLLDVVQGLLLHLGSSDNVADPLRSV